MMGDVLSPLIPRFAWKSTPPISRVIIYSKRILIKVVRLVDVSYEKEIVCCYGDRLLPSVGPASIPSWLPGYAASEKTYL
jgi:hypothetical protein